MTITVCCKASTRIGLGHLIRSSSFVNQILAVRNDIVFRYILIGDPAFKKLITTSGLHVSCYTSEHDVTVELSDIVIFDMMSIETELLEKFKRSTKKTVIFSPLFNHFEQMDYYFGRTKYLDFEQSAYPNMTIYAGLEYAIIQENCRPISAGTFEDNLNASHFPIAVIMGGGDATNKTLNVLKALKKCRVPATFWVMVGEGYKHSIDELVDEIRKDTTHEIILAKTNKSMWRILNNCVLCILPGGITTFEAVYAGLPTINFFDHDSQRFLLTELVEHGAAYDFGVYSHDTLSRVSDFIEEMYVNRKQLLKIHVNTKTLIDNQGSQRILNKLLQ